MFLFNLLASIIVFGQSEIDNAVKYRNQTLRFIMRLNIAINNAVKQCDQILQLIMRLIIVITYCD